MTRAHPEAVEPGLRLIIGYKLARAAVELVASAALAIATASGHTALLHEAAALLRHHMTSAWSARLADALVRAVEPRHLWIAVAALAFDGAFASLEGCSLYRRWTWGPFLVVVTTLAFVPFEVIALARRVDFGRLILLAANLLVAGYLGRHAIETWRSRLRDL